MPSLLVDACDVNQLRVKNLVHVFCGFSMDKVLFFQYLERCHWKISGERKQRKGTASVGARTLG